MSVLFRSRTEAQRKPNELHSRVLSCMSQVASIAAMCCQRMCLMGVCARGVPLEPDQPPGEHE